MYCKINTIQEREITETEMNQYGENFLHEVFSCSKHLYIMCFEIEAVFFNINNDKEELNKLFFNDKMEYDLVPHAYVLCLFLSSA